jgi:hypothetical protein
MDPEIKKQLEEIHALARDNHRLLRAVRHHQLFGIIVTTIFWLVILITPFYIYQQYWQPLISKFQANSGAPAGSTTTEMQKLLNFFGAGQK